MYLLKDSLKLVLIALCSLLAFAACKSLTSIPRNADVSSDSTGASPESPSTSPSWNPDFSTPEGRVDVVLSFAQKHPDIIAETLHFNRNLLESIELVSPLLQHLGLDQASMVVPGGSELSAYYFSGADFRDNTEAINKLKDLIKSMQMEVLKSWNGSGFQNLAKDFASVPQDLRWKLLAIAPFVYDPSTGQARSDMDLLERAGREDIASFYKDTMPEHYKHFFEGIDNEAAWNKFQGQNFVGGAVFQNAITPILADGGRAVSKIVSIEQLPAPMSAFRCFGGDCSIMSVPYHGFAKETRVYLIRASDRPDDRPIGQVTVVGVDTPEGVVPYAVTVNGHLNPDMVSAVLGLVVSRYKTQKIIVPNFATSGAVVNTPAMKAGMTLKDAQSLQISMPTGWQKASAFTSEHNKTGYKNYYGEKALEKAFIGTVKIDPSKIRRISVSRSYVKTSDFKSMTLWQRAVLAAQLNNSMTSERLGVSAEQVAAAGPLALDIALTAEEYQKAAVVLGFNEADLLFLNPLRAMLTLIQLDSEGAAMSPSIQSKILKNWRWVEEDLTQRLPAYGLKRKQFIQRSILYWQNISSDWGLDRMLESAKYGFCAGIKRGLLDPSIDPNAVDEGGYSALFYSIYLGSESAVKLLLKDPRLDVGRPDKIGTFPLEWAAIWGRDPILKLFLADPRFDLNRGSIIGYRPLHHAVLKNHESTVNLLLNAPQIDPNLKSIDGETALSMAVNDGFEPLVKLLLAKTRLNPNLADSTGRTPLFRAAAKGYESIIKLFLEDPRVDPNISNENDISPISIASGQGHESTVKLLLANPKVDPNKKKSAGYSPLFWAAQKSQESIIEALLSDPRVDPYAVILSMISNESIKQRILTAQAAAPRKPERTGICGRIFNAWEAFRNPLNSL